jgi:hypothetical protein
MKKTLIIFAVLFFIGGGSYYNSEENSLIFYPGRIDYPVGNNPWSVTSGDFNNDGKQDIVIANKEDDNVSLLTGNDDGTFNDASGFSVGDMPLTVISDYFNQDDYPDLATSNFGSDNLSVLLGNGDGTFQTAVNYNSGITTRCIQSEDFNGDGYQDLAVTNRDNFSVSILIGRGDGVFNDAIEFSTGQIKPRLLVAGKFNSDTTVDLAFTHAEPVELRGDIVGILPGNGDGTFGNVIIANVDVIGHFQNATSISEGDFNKDNIPDLAVGVDVTGSEETDYVSILLNNGDASFSNATPLQLGYEGDKPFYITTDFLDSDDNLDLIITGSGANSVSVHLGNGDGTFITENYYTTAQYPRWITINDFNNDLNLDVVTVNEGSTLGGTVSIFPGNGDGSLIISPTVAVDTTQPYAGVARDLDLDGDIDLAIANWGLSNVTEGVLSILHGNGDGTFNLSDSYTIGKAAKVIIAEKFNDDEYPDLAIVQDRSHNVAVFINNGSGSFQGPVNYDVDLNPLSLTSGDFNRDNKLDLVTANYNGDNFSVLPGNGDGTFGTRTDFTTSHGSRDVIAADINNDLFLDMIVLCSEISQSINLIAIHFGNGDGTFGSASNFNIPGAYAWDMAQGDFNEDNNLDLIVTDLETNEVYEYIGNGNGTFSSGNLIGQVPDPLSVIPGDYNKDNFLDIAVSDGDNDNITLFLGNGDGSFIKQVPSYGSQEAWNLIAADFDGDEDLDLAATTGIAGSPHITILNNKTIISVVEDKKLISAPDHFILEQNYPNPFNPLTKIKYSVKSAQKVTLKVFDLLGREITTLVNEEKPAGTYEVIFDAKNLPSGIYFYKISAGEFNSVKKMVLLK